MRCPHCGFQNISLAINCIQCDGSLHQKEEGLSPKEARPPRAGKLQKRMRKVPIISKMFDRPLKLGNTGVSASQALVTLWYTGWRWASYLLGLIPGLAHIRIGKPQRGMLFLGVLGVLGGISLLFWGTRIADIAFIAFTFVHAVSFIEYLQATFDMTKKHDAIPGWVVASIVGSVCIMILYLFLHQLRTSAVEDFWLKTHFKSAVVSTGDMLIVDKMFFRRSKLPRGAVVLYRLKHSSIRFRDTGFVNGVVIPNARNIDRIIGIPGDTIEFTQKGILRNKILLTAKEKPLYLQFLPRRAKIVVPRGHYFIFPSFYAASLPRRAGEQQIDLIRMSSVLSEVHRFFVRAGLVPFKRVKGHVRGIYQPWSRRRRL